jgi:hypothetical protein
MSFTAGRPAREAPSVPDLNFHVEGVEPEAHSVAPLLNFKLRIEQSDSALVQTVALRCQIRIEPGRRHYSPKQQEALLELFGQPSQWGQSLRPMLWTHTSAIIPEFSGSTVVDLPVPCTWDFNVAATKYFDALGEDGEAPLCLLFNGTIFYAMDGQPLQAAPISWAKEANFKLPVAVWRKMMEMYYPNSAWLCLNRDVFDRFRRFKIQAGHMTWEQAMEDLLQADKEKVG